MNRDPLVSLDSNILNIDGIPLRADVFESREKSTMPVQSDELTQILIDDRRFILKGIESIYEKTVQSNPGSKVVRPSIWTARLGKTHQSEGSGNRVFTESGLRNGGIISSGDEIRDDFYWTWQAPIKAGFLPEVRRASGKSMGGAWLLLRKPELTEVAQQWFNHEESTASKAVVSEIKKRDNTNSPERKQSEDNIRLYRKLGEKTIELLTDQQGKLLREHRFIGLELAIASLKYHIGDIEGYTKHIDDALLVADELAADKTTERIQPDAIRAIENSTFGT